MPQADGKHARALRILVVRVGAMGDVLHGMPAIAALRAALPDACIGWAIEPKWAPLLRGYGMLLDRGIAMPLVDTVHEVPTKQWSKQPLAFRTLWSVLALRREMRRARYDLAIDLQGSIRRSLIARMSGATRIVGNGAPRERQARWFYDTKVTVRRPNVVEQAAEIVSGAVKRSLQPLPAPLPLSLPDEEWCDGLFRTVTQHPIVLLAPTAGWGAKEWPAIRFGHLARELNDRGCTVLVNASPDGVDSMANLVVACSQGRARSVPCTLSQLIALVQRVDLIIAVDTGPLHLAAAVGVPALGLYGPTDPARNGPWGPLSQTIRHRFSKTNHRRQKRTEPGLAEITVAEVLQLALSMLRSGPRP